MRRLMVGLLAALMLAGCAASPPAPSLYDRLGGRPALQLIVRQATADAAADPRIATRLAGADIPKLNADLADRLCAASGGPCRPAIRKPEEAPQAAPLSEAEFTALQTAMGKVLDGFATPPTEKQELLGLLNDARPRLLVFPK